MENITADKQKELARDFTGDGRIQLLQYRNKVKIKADEATQMLHEIRNKSAPTDEDIASIKPLQIDSLSFGQEVKMIDEALQDGIRVKPTDHRVLSMKRILGAANAIGKEAGYSTFRAREDSGHIPSMAQLLDAGGDKIEISEGQNNGLQITISRDPTLAAIRTDQADQGAETLLTPEHSGSIIDRVLAFGGWQPWVEYMVVSHGRERKFAAIDDTSQKAAIVTQVRTNAPDATAPTQVDVSQTPFLFDTKPLRINREVEQDIEVGDIGIYERNLITRLGRGVSDKIMNGSGNDEPRGIITSATNSALTDGIAANAGGPLTTKFRYDDLVAFMGKVEPGYVEMDAGAMGVNGIGWMIGHPFLIALLGVKDDDGRPLWLPGMTALGGSLPATLIGKPYRMVYDLPALAAGKSVATYGNHKYFGVTAVNSVEINVWRDSNFGSLYQVGIQGFHRCTAGPIGGFNGNNTDTTEAIHKLTMAAN